MGHPPLRTALEVPILVRGRMFGNLYLTDKRHGASFGADDETVVRALASAAGVAIDNARLYDQSRVRRRRLEGVAGRQYRVAGGWRSGPSAAAGGRPRTRAHRLRSVVPGDAGRSG
ncbi:GAF domain-containing protein [Prescottella defluvii]|nr:GAF domain-containing protein [Prescottella defluvii]